MSATRLRWAVNLRELEKSTHFEAYYRTGVQCVTEKEYEEHRRFVYRDDSLACLVSRLLARQFAVTTTNSDWNRVVIARTERGKPFVESPSSAHQFNISHHGEYVVLASDSKHRIGVDVMRVDMDRGETADSHRQKMKNLFTVGEHAYMEKQTTEIDKWRAFYRVWCLKEAILKATGIGLVKDLRTIDFTLDETTSHLPGRYLLDTQCTENGQPLDEYVFEEHYIDDNHPVAVGTSFEDIARAKEARKAFQTSPNNFEPLGWERLLQGTQCLNMLPDSGIAAFDELSLKELKPF
ncbi:unnamed protein product, partial [Mesorhabditis spiculigera]